MLYYYLQPWCYIVTTKRN